MRHVPIHTKYHKLIGSRILLDINGQCATQATANRLLDVRFIERMIDDCDKLPRYVIQTELMKSLNTKAMMKSIETMIGADVVIHLPFDQVLVEFEEPAELGDADGSNRSLRVRQFIWLSELGDMGGKLPRNVMREPVTEKFSAVCWTLIDDIDDPAMVITPLVASCSMITKDYAKQRNIPVKGNGSGTLIRCSIGPQVHEEQVTRDLERQLINANSVEHAFGPVNDALCAMMILLHTKGVVEERIEIPAKMNKSRIGSGKAPISDHVIVKIGHVYNRAGEAIEYNHTGRTMPVHWRSGHWRNQRVGTGRSSTRPVWIKPMLVNYVEGDVPTPKPKEINI